MSDCSGVCPVCNDNGRSGDMCINCADNGQKGVMLERRWGATKPAPPALEFVVPESSPDPIAHRPTETVDLVDESGAGICTRCYSFGPFGTGCHRCHTRHGVKYLRERMHDVIGDKGVCPVCRHTGMLDEVCCSCGGWVYSKVPDKHIPGVTLQASEVAGRKKRPAQPACMAFPHKR